MLNDEARFEEDARFAKDCDSDFAISKLTIRILFIPSQPAGDHRCLPSRRRLGVDRIHQQTQGVALEQEPGGFIIESPRHPLDDRQCVAKVGHGPVEIDEVAADGNSFIPQSAFEWNCRDLVNGRLELFRALMKWRAGRQTDQAAGSPQSGQVREVERRGPSKPGWATAPWL